jgi:hypothetical protein
MTTNSDDALQARINFTIASKPGGIEEQEAQGQQNLIKSTALPIEGDWDTLTRWGIVRGEQTDNLFCHCTLPEGWKKVATDHSLWSNLVDARGLIRVNIFYKTAFYDRNAHFHVTPRFSIAGVYPDVEDCPHGKQYQVRDNGLDGRTIFIDTPVRSGEYKKKLVAIKDDIVYQLKKGFLNPNNHWKASNVTLLSESEFYGKWHNREVQQYDFLTSIDKLAIIESKKYMKQFPDDDSIWEPQFDFPAVI